MIHPVKTSAIKLVFSQAHMSSISALTKATIVTESFALILEVGGADPKSMLDMYLEKKCGCPSFLTLEDTNEKLDSAGYKLKLRTSDLDFCRSPRDDHRSSYPGMSMNSQLMTCSEAQASLSALSFSLPGPFPEHKPQRQLTMLAVTEEYDRGNSVYQHHMQVIEARVRFYLY